MRGLEISRAFYETYGRDMLESLFPGQVTRIAIGLVGEGSECLGFDDDLSRDHDFSADFCLWIPDGDEADYGFRLERAYAKLPREFMGVCRERLSPVGGNRRGVMTVGRFYEKFLGAPTAPDTLGRWLGTPPAMLRTASNGAVFRDDLGLFSAVRDTLLRGYPSDIRKKKLAAHLIMAEQAGQYNFPRSVKRGDIGAAGLCLSEFIRHAVSVVYLLNNVYEPYYKWAYRGMRDLPRLPSVEDTLVGLSDLTSSPADMRLTCEIIDDIARIFSDVLREEGLSDVRENNLAGQAYAVTATIADGVIRNMHIMEGI